MRAIMHAENIYEAYFEDKLNNMLTYFGNNTNKTDRELFIEFYNDEQNNVKKIAEELTPENCSVLSLFAKSNSCQLDFAYVYDRSMESYSNYKELLYDILMLPHEQFKLLYI